MFLIKILLPFFILFIGSNSTFAQKIFSVDYSSQADKIFFYCKYVFQADLKIHFVDYKSQAKWKKDEKKHLMF